MDLWQRCAPPLWQHEVIVPLGRVVAEVRKPEDAAGYHAHIAVTLTADGRTRHIMQSTLGAATLADAQTQCEVLLSALTEAPWSSPRALAE